MLALALSAETGMAQEQSRPAWARFAKSAFRLPPSPINSDLPVATAYVATDGRVQAMPVERLDGVAVTIGSEPARRCRLSDDLRPAEHKRLAEQIARDEGVPAELVASILRIEQRADKKTSATVAARLTSGLPVGNEDCLPAVTIRAGIRRLKDLSTRYPDRMHLLGAYHAGEEALLASGGVPSAPETLRFVAEVMNELAGGLAPAGHYRHPSVQPRRIAGAEPASRPSVPSSPSRAAGDPRWASGFVLNLE